MRERWGERWRCVCVQATRLGTRVQLVDSDKAGGLGTGILAIIIVVLLVPLVGLAAALVLWARRRTRMAADSDSAPKAEQVRCSAGARCVYSRGRA